MILLRPIAAAVLVVCFLALASCASTSTGTPKTGTTDGTFVKIEQGDYAHFLINTPRQLRVFITPPRHIRAAIPLNRELKGTMSAFIERADHPRSAPHATRVKVEYRCSYVPR